MIELLKRFERVELSAFKPGIRHEFLVSLVRCTTGEWPLGYMAILEECPERDAMKPSTLGQCLWPQVSAQFGLAWGTFTCIERERLDVAAVRAGIERTLIEQVSFEPALRFSTVLKGQGPHTVRRPFAMPSSGKPNGRVGRAITPYLSWLLSRAGYPIPECYMAGEPPERVIA